jgi:hypothetical protein
VSHLLDLTAQRRRILLDDDVLMVTESHRLEGSAHDGRLADSAPDLLDANLA